MLFSNELIVQKSIKRINRETEHSRTVEKGGQIVKKIKCQKKTD